MDEVFLPVYRRKWKESTRMSSESAIQTHLFPACPAIIRTDSCSTTGIASFPRS